MSTYYEETNLAFSHKTSHAFNDRMFAANGWLEGKRVTLLRTSGCNTVIENRSLVADSKFTGGMSTVHLLDHAALCLPEAEVYLGCPFCAGHATVTCMDNPLYKVILGNVAGVCDAAAPDVN